MHQHVVEALTGLRVDDFGLVATDSDAPIAVLAEEQRLTVDQLNLLVLSVGAVGNVPKHAVVEDVAVATTSDSDAYAESAMVPVTCADPVTSRATVGAVVLPTRRSPAKTLS